MLMIPLLIIVPLMARSHFLLHTFVKPI